MADVIRGPVFYDNGGNLVQPLVEYNPIWKIYEPKVLVYDENRGTSLSGNPDDIVPPLVALMKIPSRPHDEIRMDCSSIFGAMNYALSNAIFYVNETKNPMSNLYIPKNT